MLSGHCQVPGTELPSRANLHEPTQVIIGLLIAELTCTQITLWQHSDEDESPCLPSVSAQMKAANELAPIANVLKVGKHGFHL